MELRVLQEEKHYRSDDLQRLFQADDESFERIIDKLFRLNLIRQVSKVSENDFDILMQPNAEIESKYKYYSFKFVGMLSVHDFILLIYPKFMEPNTIQNDIKNRYQLFRRILSIIRKFNYETQEQYVNQLEGAEKYSRFGTALALVEDYYRYGLYSSEQNEVRLNTNGPIFWNKTIGEIVPVIVEDTPVYFDHYSVQSRVSEKNFFRELHKSILTDLSREFFDLFDILGFRPILLSNVSVEMHGTSENIIHRLNSEIANQYIDYKRQMLVLMREYLSEKSLFGPSEWIVFYGTNSFNLVWQSVCSACWNNSLDKTLGELKLTLKGFDSKTKLKDIITKPQWEHAKSGTVHNSVQTLRPDIVTVDAKDVYVLDAKYYDIKLDDQFLENNPGAYDVFKQYMYVDVLDPLINENNLRIRLNAFLFPGNTDSNVKLGTVKVDFRGQKTRKINLLSCPAFKMFERYLKL